MRAPLALAAAVTTLLAPAVTRAAVQPPLTDGARFDVALTRLVNNGWRVAVPRFPILVPQLLLGPVGLSRYEVVAVEPLPHRTVRLTLAVAPDPQGSPAVPETRPPGIVVPDLVGTPYTAAVARLQASPGLYVALGRVGPLRAASSRRGLDAFVVVGQEPAAGALVPAYGVPTVHGVDLSPSVVRLRLGVRGPR